MPAVSRNRSCNNGPIWTDHHRQHSSIITPHSDCYLPFRRTDRWLAMLYGPVCRDRSPPPPARAIYHHGIFCRCGGDLQDASWIVIKIYGLLGERSATHPPSGRADEMMRFVFCLLESMKLLLRLYLGEL